MKLKTSVFNESNKHYFNMAFSNKLRAFLTIMGIAIITATLVIIGYFVTSNIIKNKNINKIDENMVICQNLTQNQTNEILDNYEDINAFKFGDYIYIDMKDDDKSKTHICFVGIENQNHINLIDPFSTTIFKFDIVQGRNFVESEYMGLYKSIIVDEVSYEYMKSRKMLENDFFTYDFKDKIYKYKIVGIVSSNLNQIERYNSNFKGYSSDIYLTVYYPVEKINSLNTVLLIGNKNLTGLADSLSITYDKAVFHDYNFYYNSYNRIKTESINNYMGVVIGIIVCSIIAISIFMLFSIKERIGEIGIRKALGASSIEVFYEYVLEFGILGFIGVVLGGIIGLIIYLLSVYITNYGSLFVVFEFSITPLLAICLFSYLIVLICAIIPGIVSSKIKIVDALRFE